MACGCRERLTFSHVEHRKHFTARCALRVPLPQPSTWDDQHVKTSKARLDSCCQSLTVPGSSLVSLKEIPIGVRTGSDVRSATWTQEDLSFLLPISVKVQERWYAPYLLHALARTSRQHCRCRTPPESVQISIKQMGFRLVVSKEQWHRGVEWIRDENLPSSCASSSDQFQSQLRHFRCPIGEVSNDQPRAWLPGFFKSCQDRRHEAEWPVLQLTKLPKTQGHPSRKARSRHKVV